MFEDSMMESAGQIKTKTGTVDVGDGRDQCVHPGHSDPDSAAVSRSAAEDGDDRAAGRASATASATSTASAPQKVKPVKIVSEIDQGLHAPTKIPKDIKMIKEDAPPSDSGGWSRRNARHGLAAAPACWAG